MVPYIDIYRSNAGSKSLTNVGREDTSISVTSEKPRREEWKIQRQTST